MPSRKAIVFPVPVPFLVPVHPLSELQVACIRLRLGQVQLVIVDSKTVECANRRASTANASRFSDRLVYVYLLLGCKQFGTARPNAARTGARPNQLYAPFHLYWPNLTCPFLFPSLFSLHALEALASFFGCSLFPSCFLSPLPLYLTFCPHIDPASGKP